jgi:hypothetical protein
MKPGEDQQTPPATAKTIDSSPRGQNSKPGQNREVTAELFRFSYTAHKIPISRASPNATCPILTDRSMLGRAVSFPTPAYCC